MPSPSSEKPSQQPGRWAFWTRSRQQKNRPLGWRITVPIACASVGLLATTSMINAKGTDLRGGRHSSVAGIVGEQTSKVEDLNAQIESLHADIDELTEQVSGGRVDRLQERVDRIEVPAGLQALHGPGLSVSLDDAPLDQPIDDEVNPNWLVVHQQDIQAVVNALWAGGAEGISLQGQRIISTTGIKCVGNTVVLQGVPYSPPYDIVAVGNRTAMYDALLTSPEVLDYRQFTEPPYNLGWSLSQHDDIEVPAYTGSLALDHAKPLEPGD